MSLIADDSTIMAKTKDLCSSIVEESEFKTLQESVEKFLGNDEARLQYQSVHERGEELNHKQRSGVELSEADISAFEEAREELLKNEVVTNFMEAQRELQTLQMAIGKYVGLTLELGRVPDEEDFVAANGGCCGGGGGGGCGC
ncbi:Cell fate regulator YlbF, YheA/YmcA/DUF963 family (controls sporulation, competence, biofilm development) [Rubritalea squalenifaciens DSM 18772]|uniref:Cell fate regulator YlbF, YheA/YmcA/DUF963 family (Controls sporulation, competence, biofilm development) n=2 Tax=Rubritalea TaxID=361050 RepID=A0A1M6J3L4_9BACT|nr:YlbF family regulator [Rubritalea squalenifaciens]SHJ41283.1 Cell fate regulator YlbF, YheA/YmcA/DUF963 family (controls sporulation, competence, biofilm development) [Rubritalea squalenifaciens DSM 18772]